MAVRITHADDAALDDLCRELADRAPRVDQSRTWPAEGLELCAQHGVYEWFLPESWGGQQWEQADLLRGYLKLSAACLTTTFIITQFTGACRRIAACDNEPLKRSCLGALVRGEKFATLGISHLTTSRRHLKRPVMAARSDGDGFVLDGYSPWVTGGRHADLIVTGATLDDGRQLLAALRTEIPGVTADKPADLVAVSASDTGKVSCDGVRIAADDLIAGPVENVMSQGVGGNTGGLQTSTLAVGLAAAAIEFLAREADRRPDLAEPAAEFRREHTLLAGQLLDLATGGSPCSLEELRTRANSIVLRAAQAALAAAKGAGFVGSHPAGRWCREALFFLVWSCPQPVMAANLCELAGLEG